MTPRYKKLEYASPTTNMNVNGLMQQEGCRERLGGIHASIGINRLHPLCKAMSRDERLCANSTSILSIRVNSSSEAFTVTLKDSFRSLLNFTWTGQMLTIDCVVIAANSGV